MKLKLIGFETDYEVQRDCTTVLTIKDKHLYVKTIFMLNEIVSNKYDTNEILLFDNDKEISIDKNVIFIPDTFSFNLNEKQIINKLQAKIIEDTCVNSAIELNVSEIMDTVNSAILKIINYYDIGIDFDSLELPTLIKCCKLGIEEDYDELISKLFYIVDVMSELFQNHLLIFTNLSDLLTEDEITKLVSYSNYKKIYILLIDHEEMNYEGIVNYVIDSDFSENILFDK
ncbi:MAG: type II-A CRISPR-associated protein Csn2 [Thomasclavelia sp.]|nr:type II-A CRISPR-associated protein Csn2 [Thomasclavelia sp.]